MEKEIVLTDKEQQVYEMYYQDEVMTIDASKHKVVIDTPADFVTGRCYFEFKDKQHLDEFIDVLLRVQEQMEE